VISITDSEKREPNLATPNTDKELPSRETLRNDNDEPKSEHSKTESVEHRRAKPLKERDDAR